MAKLILACTIGWLLGLSIAVSDNEWNYGKQSDWKGTGRDGMQSPINISSPYTKKVNITGNDLLFEYCEVDNTYFSHTGNNLKLYGDFGKLKFNGRYYIASEITFFKNSEHTFGAQNKTTDLEIQIQHEDLHGKLLIVVVTYKLNVTSSIFFDQLKFSQVKGMKKGDKRFIQNPIDVGLIFNKISDYVYYKGSQSRPPGAQDVEYIVLANQKQISQEDLDSFPDELVNKKRETQNRKDREIIIMSMKNKVDTTKLGPDGPNLNYNRLAINFTDTLVPYSGSSNKNNININSDLYPAVSEITTNLPFTKKKVVVEKPAPIEKANNTLEVTTPTNSTTIEAPNEATNTTSSPTEAQNPAETNENSSTDQTTQSSEISSNTSAEQAEGSQTDTVVSQPSAEAASVSSPSSEENGVASLNSTSQIASDSSAPLAPSESSPPSEEQPKPASSRVQSKSPNSRKSARIEKSRLAVQSKKKAASSTSDNWLPNSSRMSISELESIN